MALLMIGDTGATLSDHYLFVNDGLALCGTCKAIVSEEVDGTLVISGGEIRPSTGKETCDGCGRIVEAETPESLGADSPEARAFAEEEARLAAERAEVAQRYLERSAWRSLGPDGGGMAGAVIEQGMARAAAKKRAPRAWEG